MDKKDIEELRDRVLCGAVLEHDGWTIDLKESTPRAVKFRRGDEIVIVIHDGKGWFDPQSEAKGDVFSLAEHLGAKGFVQALNWVGELVGFVPTEPAWTRQSRNHPPEASIADRWRARRTPWPRSLTWQYLTGARFLPNDVVRDAIRQDRLREGPYGSMWAAHVDNGGIVTGWEERGPQWRGFAGGGSKILFRFGLSAALRICVTEAAIDAMSLATLEALRKDSLYLSTGGGWAPATQEAIRELASRPNTLMVAATDNNDQGDVYAHRLKAIAKDTGCYFERLRPKAGDWNQDLRDLTERRGGGKEKEEGPAACPLFASRVKLRPAAPALDPTGRDGGCGGGVRKG